MLRITAAANAHARGIIGLDTASLGSRSLLASCAYDGAVKLWELESGQLHLLHTLTGSSTGPVFSVALNALRDALMLCSGSHCRRLSMWRCSLSDEIVGAPALQWRSAQHTGWVRAIAVNEVGDAMPKELYSIGCNRVLCWSLQAAPDGDGRSCDGEIAIFEDAQQVRSHDVLCLGHGDGNLAAGSVDGALRVWATAGVAAADMPQTRAAHWIGHNGQRVADVAWLRDGHLISAGYDGRVRSWRRVDGTSNRCPGAPAPWALAGEVRAATSAGGRALALASGRGDRVLCGTSDGAISLFRGPGLAPVDTLRLDGRRATAAASVLTRGGDGESLFVVGDSDGDLHVVCDQ